MEHTDGCLITHTHTHTHTHAQMARQAFSVGATLHFHRDVLMHALEDQPACILLPSTRQVGQTHNMLLAREAG